MSTMRDFCEACNNPSFDAYLAPFKLENTEDIKTLLEGHKQKVMACSLDYPIIVLSDNSEKMLRILDGNHRLIRAVIDEKPSISVRCIKADFLSDKYSYVFDNFNQYLSVKQEIRTKK